MEYRGGKRGECRQRWYRVHANKDPYAEPSPIQGAEGEEYMATSEDVGCFLMFEFTPVRADGEEGPAVTCSTGLIAEAAPQVFGAHMAGGGAPTEGTVLEMQGSFFGGEEKGSRFRWYREDPAALGGFTLLQGHDTHTYTATANDVGRMLMCEWLPRNASGKQGPAVKATTDREVREAPPQIEAVAIQGTGEEGHEVRVCYDYTGGVEGDSRVQWYREADWAGMAPIEGACAATYTPQRHDIGHRLYVEVTPVRRDGTSGESVGCHMERRVREGHPKVKTMSVTGQPCPGGTLRGVVGYVGGLEGISSCVWLRDDQITGELEEIPGSAQSLSYHPTEEDLGHMVVLHYTPIRDDGAVGPTCEANPNPNPNPNPKP